MQVLLSIATAFITILLCIAVAWQTFHLIEWAVTLWDAHGNGDVAAYLRQHADTYLKHVFGDLFDWNAEEVAGR